MHTQRERKAAQRHSFLPSFQEEPYQKETAILHCQLRAYVSHAAQPPVRVTKVYRPALSCPAACKGHQRPCKGAVGCS